MKKKSLNETLKLIQLFEKKFLVLDVPTYHHIRFGKIFIHLDSTVFEIQFILACFHAFLASMRAHNLIALYEIHSMNIKMSKLNERKYTFSSA